MFQAEEGDVVWTIEGATEEAEGGSERTERRG